jgi:hypothetical protein
MHDMMIKNAGSYSESSARLVQSIMCSSSDAEGQFVRLSFLGQAKVIWKNAFSVNPQFPSTGMERTLWNKTIWQIWPGTPDDFKTVPWKERRGRFLGGNPIAFPLVDLGHLGSANPPRLQGQQVANRKGPTFPEAGLAASDLSCGPQQVRSDC